MPKVLFNTDFIAPYRKTFFEKICATRGFDWLILFGRKTTNDGKPDFRGEMKINGAVVENRELSLGPYLLRFQKGALEACSRFSPDVLVVFGVPGALTNWLLLLWGKVNRKPLLMWVSGWESQPRGSWSLWIKQSVLRVFYSLPDKCLVYSSTGARYLRRLGVAAERIVVCHNGIEIDDMVAQESEVVRKAGEIRRAWCREGEVVFLYVGAIIADKRLDLLIRAVSLLKKEGIDARLWVAGDGPFRKECEELADSLGLPDPTVRFLGRIIEGIDCYFSAADVFVLPGLGGLALNQAMFWKTPCIVSVADGTEDDLVIDGVTGKRFEADDLDSLTGAMRACSILGASERQVWGERARRLIVERSNVTRMVEVFVENVDAALKGCS